MAGINEYDKNPDNNTSINGINIAEGWAAPDVNNAIRQAMADTINAATYELYSTSFTTVNTGKYLCDTSTASFTATLPGSPAIGDNVKVRDAADWSTNPLTIGRNGNTIGGVGEDLVLNTKSSNYEFVWDGSTWEYTQLVSDAAEKSGDNTFTGSNTFDGTSTFNGTTTFTGTVIGAEEVGVMKMFCGEALPTGYIWADGVDKDRTTYAALFAVLGTKWGEGDGSTTFGIPDMTERVPRGASGNAGSTLGEYQEDQVGTHTHTATQEEHTHTVTGGDHSHDITDPGHVHPDTRPSGGANTVGGTYPINSSRGNSTSSTTGITIDTSGDLTLTADSQTPVITVEDNATDAETRVKATMVNYIIKV